MIDNERNTVKELTLILMYLTSWRENNSDEECLRAWKGYEFDILDELANEELINGSRRAKSVCITEKGIEFAKELLKKYNIKT